ncbi:ubiquitin-like modifier-activating enzyme 6 [Babylonia areolata]|uniref:ubiquitin-like modifier-activating enzyme 6 n=1 Tax=Babylonia areolata TaxID=304850 RepID=UPI003FD3E1CA
MSRREKHRNESQREQKEVQHRETMASNMEIDDSLYSRQRYVLGDSAMKRMAQSSVLICGLGGLGVEIAKNIVLAGVRTLTVQDTKTCTVSDLGTQFFVRQSDIDTSKNRAEACAGRLAELNPYVKIATMTEPLNLSTDLTYMKQFDCVILTECRLSVQLYVNKFCRACSPLVKFISSDVFGVFGSAFCDFGDTFEVMDPTGEEPKEVFIAKITKADPGVVTCLDNRLHGLETGDLVTFKEIKGMEQLNSRQCEVKVLSPTTFSVCDTSGSEFGEYESGGIMTQVKVPKTVHFKSLEEQLVSPSLLLPDLSKFNAPANIHLAFQALHQFWAETGSLPQPWCSDSADRLVALAKTCSASLAEKNQSEAGEVDEKTVRCVSHTAAGCLAAMCAAIGGIVAQEGLKALTGKFLPLSQWLYLDAMETIPDLSSTCPESFQLRNDRLDPLRICVGQEVCQKLADTRLFMVGCGAIGCEMLKNYALLGVGTSQTGQITITDNDLIEKSNLNRQFLFRPHHIQKPKSTTAAQAAIEINSALHIEAQQHKVCPQTESSHYTDAFFEAQDIMVNALDNLEARRYMDSRCVTNQRPLLESGTMGTKGHVQVIVPHLTESYTSQQDPADEDFPYCTVKSFPATIEHCIQWARDKFEELYVNQPNLFNKFIASNADIAVVVDKLKAGDIVDGGMRVSKMAASRPRSWDDCVRLARVRFEKYFNHKAQQLLHAFPLDTKLPDNSLFWQSPKRPPTPLHFNSEEPLHLAFITSTARLLCDIYGIPAPSQVNVDDVKTMLQSITVPSFVPSNKKIETDESKSMQEVEAQTSSDDVTAAGERLAQVVMSSEATTALKPMTAVEFEKDDDSNEHINFIAACSNLRAGMYSIETVDRLKIKRIAGRIVPAIATTTAAVSGLVTVELIKVLQQRPLESLKNAFLNLALPLLLLSEPGACVRKVLKEGLSVSVWDKWTIRGSKDFTLQQFLNSCKEQFGFEATAVVNGVKIIYMPIMAPHKKRLPQTMMKLIKPEPGNAYVDLVVCFEDDKEEEIEGPPVRYFFGN